MIFEFTFMDLIVSYDWMLTVRLFGDLFIGSLLIRGCDRFDRYLGKSTTLQVGFVFFLLNTKNRENLVASPRSIAVQGGGMRCKSSTVPHPSLPLPFFRLPYRLVTIHLYIGVDERRCKCTVNLSRLRTRHSVSGQGSYSDNSSRSPVL